MYLLNDVKHIMLYIPNGKFVDNDNKKNKIVEIVDERKYDPAVSECNKLQTFIKIVVGGNITVLSEQ